MTRRHRPTYDWRRKTKCVAEQLDEAHSAVEALGTALDEGNGSSSQHVEATAKDAVGFVAESVKNLRTEQPPAAEMDDLDRAGSTLAIGGGGVATVALDVMVNAMMALAATDDGDETDLLVSASLDAGNAYEVGVGIVEAVPQADEPGMVDLKQALRTEGSKALTKRVIQARHRVLAIRERVGTS